MSLVLGLGLSLALGALAELTAGAVTKISRRGSWLAPFTRFGADVRALVRERDPVSASEALGVGAAAVGGSLAAAAALGGIPGSAVLLYLALVLACTGGHLASATAPTAAGVQRATGARLLTLAAEPAFALSIGAIFLRWRAADLDAIRGAHDVLGLGVTVGDAAVVAGVLMAAVGLSLSAALRLPPEPGEEAGAGGGVAVAGTLARWLVAGSSAIAVGALLAARTTPSPHPFSAEGSPMLAVAVVATLLLGLARGFVILSRSRTRFIAAATAASFAAAAAILVSSA